MALALSSGAIFMPQEKSVGDLLAVYDRNSYRLPQKYNYKYLNIIPCANARPFQNLLSI
jgi:hypothetical protein